VKRAGAAKLYGKNDVVMTGETEPKILNIADFGGDANGPDGAGLDSPG
jgi:hypothetical protein